MYFDPVYFLFLAPALLLSLIAQFRVKAAYSRYSEEPNSRNLTGAQIARELLEVNGIKDVAVEETGGMLTDHYDPMQKVLRLSSGVYHSPTVTAAGIAAHEAGHAIQHAQGYTPMYIRQTMAPVTMIASNLSMFVIMIGFIIGALGLLKLGIAAFSLVVLFQLVTLPVEFDASSRAKNLLLKYNLISVSDSRGVSAVLNAAALTYVAAAVSSILTLIYYLFRAGLLGGGRSDD